MTTLADARARLRRTLEDTDTVSPVWSDTELNDFLASAHREYGARFPREASATLAFVPGQLTYTLPADLRRVLWVESPAGTPLPRRPLGVVDYGDAGRCWTVFGGALRFDAAPTADIIVMYRGLYPFPTTDAGDFGLPDEGADLALAGALILALQRREMAVAKRAGGAPSVDLVLASARRAYAERLVACRRFRATRMLG